VSPTHPDFVTSLPGLTDKPEFKHYSGYLDATEGRKLHYWFIESERSPGEDPLVLWMNGGPGCSSLAGLLTEQGPWRVNKTNNQQLYSNPHRWNQVANVIFLEAPAGVGFSYKDNDEDYSTDDDQVAKDNHVAIVNFFAKFPQFKTNPFFVTGESYGGIYVPTLATRILRLSPEINLQGFAIGNGYLDRVKLADSLLLFGYFHGVYGKTTWNALLKGCCSNATTEKFNYLDPSKPNGCSFVSNPSKACRAAIDTASEAIRSNDINIYNLYQECDFPSGQLNTIHERLLMKNASFIPVHSREHHDRKIILKTLGIEQSPMVLNALKDSPPCVDDSYVARYLNQKSVRSALHVPSHVRDWEICSTEVEVSYTTKYETMKPQILELLRAGKRGLIYNGDVDMACNFLGDEWFVDDLGLNLVSDYKEWHIENQVGGYVKHFENLVFATVKGSGHMVPGDKPAAALALIVGFLE
jgi:cathepsin A (carboxypeptidase C)